eukprot:scaffold144013_cov28-Tisochrysis_lutea.AAC.1
MSPLSGRPVGEEEEPGSSRPKPLTQPCMCAVFVVQMLHVHARVCTRRGAFGEGCARQLTAQASW